MRFVYFQFFIPYVFSSGSKRPECSVVPEYKSDEEENVEEVPKNRVISRKRKHWELVKEYSDEEEAMDWINEKDMWVRHYSNFTIDGKKTYYRCKKAKYREKQCEPGINLLYDAFSTRVSLYQTVNTHTHTEQDNNTYMNDDVKKAVEAMFEANMKCKAILLELGRKNMFVPPEPQLNNYLKKLRNKKYKPYEFYLNDLVK